MYDDRDFFGKEVTNCPQQFNIALSDEIKLRNLQFRKTGINKTGIRLFFI